MKKKNMVTLFLSVIAVVLEILPYGAVLSFGLDSGETSESYYSYFSLTPYGYANFLPFITAVLTCVLVIMTVIILFKDSPKLKKACKVLALCAFAVAAASFALANFTITAALIALALCGVWVGALIIYKS